MIRANRPPLRRLARLRPIASIGFNLLIAALLLAGTLDTRKVKAAVRPEGGEMPAVLAETFNDIGDYYIASVALRDLAISGINRLETPAAGLVAEAKEESIVLKDRDAEIAREPEPASNDAQAWADAVSRLVSRARQRVPAIEHLSDDEVYTRLFAGFIQRLDRFTRYASPGAAEDQRAQRDGFGGIGVILDYGDGLPRITEVLPDGPAAHAGLLVDDRLANIDGRALEQLSPSEIPNRLRGGVGTQVAVGVERGAPNPQKFILHLVRALVVPPTVTTAVNTDGIGIFKISQFNHSTANSLAEAIGDVQRRLGSGFKGAILDLRDNPGGLLDQGVDVASLFLDGGQVISTNGRHPRSLQYFNAGDRDRLHGLPLVVLVNGGSASAAEIVAAALQDRGRSVTIGSSSYGKGTVQMVLTLPNNAELTLTWARMVTPAGYILHEHGVVPAFCTARAPAEPIEVDPTEIGLVPLAADPAVMNAIIADEQHPVSPLARTPRARFSEAQWQALRQSCPPTNDDKTIDLALADRVATTPALYSAALAAPGVSVAGLGTPPAGRHSLTVLRIAH